MTPIYPYAPNAHFWKVDGRPGFWSSAAKAYVDALPFDDFPATEIESEAALRASLSRQGFPQLAPGYVPERVEMWQAKAALRAAGLFDAADAAVTASDNIALQSVWIDGNTVRRDSPAIAAMAAVLELTAEQVDGLFIVAEGIQA